MPCDRCKLVWERLRECFYASLCVFSSSRVSSIVLGAGLSLALGIQHPTVLLFWDPNPESDGVTGYVLYWGPASGTYTESWELPVVMFFAVPCVPGEVNYYAIKAKNKDGLSGFSNEVRGECFGKELPMKIVPHPIGNITVEVIKEG